MTDHEDTQPLRYGTSQAAEILGVSLGTVRRWSDMGALESSRTPGGQRRFSQQMLERFARQLRVSGDE
jgi:excisionase family DNA binding protein